MSPQYLGFGPCVKSSKLFVYFLFVSLLFAADILREAPYSAWVLITTFRLNWNRQWDAFSESRSVIFWNYTTDEFVTLESMWQFKTSLDVVNVLIFQTKSLECMVVRDVMKQLYCFISIILELDRVGRKVKSTSRQNDYENQWHFF